MDRFGVAIQEILKHYSISSDENSSRNDLWKQFPESQQELMLPLLTSRYIVSNLEEMTFPNPIFGSSQGAEFQTWLYKWVFLIFVKFCNQFFFFSWTKSLIMTLPQQNQTVLTPCLPAMKQDNRILMQFLPHILLHSIISDTQENMERAFIEIKAVVGSFTQKKNDSELLVISVFKKK